MPERKVGTIIVGGGISGLTLLNRLAASGHDVLLLERSEHVGGVCRTHRSSSGALIEYGPNSAQLNPSLARLIDELELSNQLVRANPLARKRYVVVDGVLRALPMNPIAFVFSRALSLSAKCRLMMEPFIKKSNANSDESIEQFAVRRMGRGIAANIVDPFVSGVYAGRMDTLSAQYALPRMVRLEREHGRLLFGALASMRRARRAGSGNGHAKHAKGMFSFRDGMQTLPNAIANRWRETIVVNNTVRAVERNGDEWIVNTEREPIHCDRVVFASPALDVADMISGVDAALGNLLRGTHYPPLATCVSVYNRSDVTHPLDGFGMLIPSKEQRNILGTIFSSSIFPDRVPNGWVELTSFIGGARHPELAMKSESEIAAIVHAELVDLLGIRAQPIEVHVNKLARSIPQYEIGHGDILDAIDRAEASMPGLHILGNYRNGVSYGDCVEAAEKLASKIINA